MRSAWALMPAIVSSLCFAFGPAAAQPDSTGWLVPYVQYGGLDPGQPAPGEPVRLTLLGWFPYDCGEIADTNVVASRVELTMRPRAASCADTARSWTGTFPLGAFTSGTHTITVQRTLVWPDGSTEVREGSLEIFVGDPPPPGPPCPLFSHFTTSPAAPNDEEPTHVTLFGCHPDPCGEVVGAQILAATQVEVTLRQGSGCTDSVTTWSRSFDLGVLPAGSHNLIVYVRDAATPWVAQVFGTWFEVSGDAPPPPPPPPPPTGGPLFTGARTMPDPARTSEPTVLVAHGYFPYECGFVSGVRSSPTYVSMTVNRAVSCPPETSLAWEQGFDLGFLEAGRHRVRIAIRDAGSPDSTTVHEYSHEFDVVGDGGPPPPPPPVDSLILSRPNPFARETRFGLVLEQTADLQIGIYDLQGRTVRSVFRGRMPAGTWEFTWDGRREDGSRAPAGVYFYRVIRPGRTASGRVVLTSTP